MMKPIVTKVGEKILRRKESRSKKYNFKLMGNNANSLLSKMESLENVLSVDKPSAIFLQETRLRRAGRIKTPSTHGMNYIGLNKQKRVKLEVDLHLVW